MSQTEKAGAGQDRPHTQPAAGKSAHDYKSRDGRDHGSRYDASGRQRSGGRPHGQGGEHRQSGDRRRDFGRSGDYGHERDMSSQGDFAGARPPRGKNRVYTRRDGPHADAADYQDMIGPLADTSKLSADAGKTTAAAGTPRDGAQQPKSQPERGAVREQFARGRAPKTEPTATIAAAAARGVTQNTPSAGANRPSADTNGAAAAAESVTASAAGGRQPLGATGRGRHAHTAPKVKAEESIDDIRADIVRIEKEIGLEIMEIQSLNLAL